MRAIWSGLISFGLVNIPVKLYSATEGQGLSFHMLHDKDLSPIRFARVCRADGKEIPYENIVKGYEYVEGDYVVLLDQDFERANIKRTKTIEILDFTEDKQVDDIYFVRPYYLEPEKNAEKAYALLREALKRSKKIGIAKFVLRNREHLAALKPLGNTIVLNEMRFKDEVRDIGELKFPDKDMVKPNELDIALKLIDQLSGPFKPEKYHDNYTVELKKLIEEKSKGLKPKSKGKVPQPTKVPDIMATLRESLERHQKQGRA
jgi:DNA end-binding protein Ku